MIGAHERTLHANSGGPMSRTRTQQLAASLLRGDHAVFDFRARLGVDFGKHDPLLAAERALRSARIRDPAELRERFEVPREPCLCRPDPAMEVPRLRDLSLEEFLQQVLLLSLSTPCLLDPRRPILLTRTALARRLEVYTGRGYYA